MSSRQSALHGFFGSSPTKEVAASLSKEEELKQAVKEATASPSKAIKLEDELRMSSEEVGRIFVPNGSRDRYGQPRKNVGGRPKKNAGLEEELLGAAKKKSNRKVPGSRARKEFSAGEKIQLVANIKAIYKQAHLSNIGKKQAEVRTS